jgi:group I intron endonuclease
MGAGGIVYLVTCRVTGKHYVGQTTRSLAFRWGQHLARARRGSNYPLHAAIRKHGADSFTVEMLEEVADRSGLNERELYYAGLFHTLSPDGYNLKAGDGHLSEFSEETRRKMGAASKAHQTPEVREQTAALMRARWADRDWRARRSALFRQAQSRPEVRAANSARQVGVQKVLMNRPEVRAKLSAAQRLAHARPEVRSNHSEGARRMWSKPGHRERHAASLKVALNRPGAQARRIASARANRLARVR